MFKYFTHTYISRYCSQVYIWAKLFFLCKGHKKRSTYFFILWSFYLSLTPTHCCKMSLKFKWSNLSWTFCWTQDVNLVAGSLFLVWVKVSNLVNIIRSCSYWFWPWVLALIWLPSPMDNVTLRPFSDCMFPECMFPDALISRIQSRINFPDHFDQVSSVWAPG